MNIEAENAKSLAELIYMILKRAILYPLELVALICGLSVIALGIVVITIEIIRDHYRRSD